MGTDKHDYQDYQVKKTKTFFFRVMALLAFVGISVAIPFIWDALSRKEERKLEQRLKEIDEAEQYALVAIEDGWYPCNHRGRPVFYLKKGEIWKYGTTTKGQRGRGYSSRFLQNMKVSYILQFRGSLSDCLKEEQIKLYHYPYLPENLERLEIDRLPRPPYNSKMQ